MKLNAYKDGNGNIVITEDSFEILLACLDNQKFVGELPQNGDSLSVGEEVYDNTQQGIQNTIDLYNRECRKILHQKYMFNTTNNGLCLYKKYEHQDKIIPWSGEDVGLIYGLYEDTRIENSEKTIMRTNEGDFEIETESRCWLIERPLIYDYDYLTISEDGINNRPWKEDEIIKIKELFDNKE